MSARINRALGKLLEEIYLYEEMIERRFVYAKEADLKELQEEIGYLESMYSFVREQVATSPKKKSMKFRRIDF